MLEIWKHKEILFHSEWYRVRTNIHEKCMGFWYYTMADVQCLTGVVNVVITTDIYNDNFNSILGTCATLFIMIYSM